MQFSKHCKAHTDEEDSVLLSESMTLSSKEMTTPPDERDSMAGVALGTQEGWTHADEREKRQGLWAPPRRILIGGNEKDSRMWSIPERGNDLGKCTEKANTSSKNT